MRVKRKTDEQVLEVCEFWARMEGQDETAATYTTPRGLTGAVRQFVQRLPMAEVLDAVSVTFDKVGEEAEYRRFKFFCGVCWHKIKQPKGTDHVRESVQPHS